MKYIFFFFAFLITCKAQAQFGIHASYQIKNSDSNLSGNEFPLNGWGTGIDYTFRLANLRIEFFPELNYAQLKTQSPSADANRTTPQIENQQFSFVFNTNFYLFDFEGDCDCPVWSKEGNFLKKGFFLQVSPGIHYHNFTYSEENDFLEPYTADSDFLSYSIGGGAGIDFGISEKVSLTPYFRARYHLPVEAEGYLLNEDEPQVEQEFAVWQLVPGIRLGVQLQDEFTRNKRMRNRREAARVRKQKKGRRGF